MKTIEVNFHSNSDKSIESSVTARDNRIEAMLRSGVQSGRLTQEDIDQFNILYRSLWKTEDQTQRIRIISQLNTILGEPTQPIEQGDGEDFHYFKPLQKSDFTPTELNRLKEFAREEYNLLL